MKKGLQSNTSSAVPAPELAGLAKEAKSVPPLRPVRLAEGMEWNSSWVGLNRTDAPSTSSLPLPALPTLPGITSGLALERTQELVTTHALRLKQLAEGTLQVVIKPGDGTQLTLDLRRVAGTIEVRAELNQGDFHFFSRHWSDLQQQLEARGIRLGELTGGLAGGHDERYRQPDAEGTEDLVPFPGPTRRATRLTPVTTEPAAFAAGWEYWA